MDKSSWNVFFNECPYLDTWVDTMGRNKYLKDVANYNVLLGTLKLKKRKLEERRRREEEERKKGEEYDTVAVEEKTEQDDERVKEMEEDDEKDGHEGEKGELQFHVMRNCDVHIPESVVKVNLVISLFLLL